ncbi:hypothetical protein G6F65_021615 [Rhizopus arrhizus]|nr:hypothetical protein G6F65_021615 [Rhizopus arrhizus]
MQGVVDLPIRLFVRRLGIQQGLETRAQSFQRLGRNTPRRHRRRLAFQEATDLQQFQQIRHTERPHHYRPVGQALQHAFAQQPIHRGAQRRARHIQLIRQAALLQHLTSRNPARNDLVQQCLIGALRSVHGVLQK